jgi:hypothetical protein
MNMRRKHAGYIFQFTLSDHAGRHIHVFKDDRELGVYDRVDGPVRGLEQACGIRICKRGWKSLSVN